MIFIRILLELSKLIHFISIGLNQSCVDISVSVISAVTFSLCFQVPLT